MTVALFLAMFAAFGGVIGAMVWTLRQGSARRAAERIAALVARDGVDVSQADEVERVERAEWVELVGCSVFARPDVNGAGALTLTSGTVDFRLGQGTSSLSIPRRAIIDVTVASEFRAGGRTRRFRGPRILAIRWQAADGSEGTAAFVTRHATEWSDDLDR